MASEGDILQIQESSDLRKMVDDDGLLESLEGLRREVVHGFLY